MSRFINISIFDFPINLDHVKHHIDSLAMLSDLDQQHLVNIIFMKIEDTSSYIKKAIVNMLIDSGRIDFKTVLKNRAWLCNFSPTEYVLSDERVSASMRAEPKLLKQCNDTVLENKTVHIASLRMIMPSDIEAPSLDKVIPVPVYNIKRHTYSKQKLPGQIVEMGDCQFEMTDAVITKFYKKLEYLKQDKDIKEVLNYSIPSIFPTESSIDAISDENPLKSKMAHWEQLKVLNDPSMDILSRRAKLVELSNIIDTVDILELIKLSYDMIKPTQIIKVKFLKNDKEGYYVLHNCSINSPVNIADDYIIKETDTEVLISPVAPQIRKVGGVDVLNSELPRYSLPEISAINSWITNGLLSTFLMRREFLQSICTNPLIGNWGYIQDMMNRQFSILYSASKPLEADTLLYRGSPHFKEDPVRMRTVIATSKLPHIANQFTVASLAKKIIVPAGTRVIDLSPININEQEVLIFPSKEDSNLLIEPVELLRNKTKRNTYRVRNVNKAGGGKRRRKTCRK